MADEAEELRLHEVRHGELKLDLQTLAQIEAAQARMQEGLYGLCITCGQPIARDACSPCLPRSLHSLSKPA